MKKTLSSQKGFTLIELLVVIAIIGILASVVLASLSTARQKGRDASVKSQLSSTRAQAEIYADGNGQSYVDVCTETVARNGIATLIDATDKIDASTGAAGINGSPATVGHNAGSTTIKGACNDSAGAWAAQFPLNTKVGGVVQSFCVDSSGAAMQTVVLLADGTDYTCN